MGNSKSRNVVKQLVGVSGLEAAGQVISFLGVLAYTNLTPKGVLGSYFLLLVLVRIGSSVGGTGVTTHIVRKIGRAKDQEHHFTTGLVFIIIVSAAIGCASLALTPLVNEYISGSFGWALAVFIPAELYARFLRAALQGEEKNVRALSLVTVQKSVTYFCGIVALLTGIAPVTALLGGLLIGKTTELGGAIVFTDLRPRGVPSFTELRELGESVVVLTTASIGNLGQREVDTLLIGALLTPAAVAAYEIAWRLSAVGLIATNGLTSVLYPRFSALAEENDIKTIKEYARRALFYAGVPMIAQVVGAVAIGESLVTVLYSVQYVDAYIPLLILLVARVPYSITQITTVVGYTLDLDRQVTRTSVIAVLVNAGLNVLLIPAFGIEGAAVGSLLSYATMSLMLIHETNKRISLTPPVLVFVPSLISAGVMYALVVILSSLLVGDGLETVLLLVVIGAAVYAGSLVLLSPTTRDDFQRILKTEVLRRWNSP